MKVKITAIIICYVVIVEQLPGYAYDNKEAHPKFNQAVVEEFVRRLPIYMLSYNEFKRFEKFVFNDFDKTPLKGVDVLEPGYQTITEGPSQMTAKKWIRRGGYTADEPEIIAALRHFYDPVANNQGCHYLTDLGTEVVNPAIDAIYWAFTGTDQKDRTNDWTWDKGKEYLKMGLESQDEEKANEYFGKAFRCLGEVLHNTADMGCPPHVRNDAHGGYPGIGGSDPYESLFKAEWVDTYAGTVPDPEYARIFRTTNSGEMINKALAEFTNKNFFSDETISGTGLKEYTSKNKMPDYPHPKLQNLQYKPLIYGYVKKFESKRDIVLCVDKVSKLGDLFTLRADPWIDETSVHSQATELIPNIIEAGINLFRIFIPDFSLELSQDKGIIKVNVKHIATVEYPTPISYAGKLIFMVKHADGKISIHKENILEGKFEGNPSYIRNGDNVQASIEFADISINSNELVAKKEEMAYEWINKIYQVAAQISWGCPVAGTKDYEFVNISSFSVEDCNCTFSGTSFICERSIDQRISVSFGVKTVTNFTYKFSGNINISDQLEGKPSLNCKVYSDETIENHSGYNYSEFSSKRTIVEMEIINLPFWHSDPTGKQVAFYFEKNKEINQKDDVNKYLGKVNYKKIIAKGADRKETITQYCPVNADKFLIISGHFFWK